MLDYCDRHCDDENGKIAVCYSSCYLEKVAIRRRSPDQILVNIICKIKCVIYSHSCFFLCFKGLKLTSLSDGIFTITEIAREVK